MRSIANPETTAVILNCFKPDTPQLYVTEAPNQTFGASDYLVTPVNDYILISLEKSNRYVLHGKDVTKYILLSDKSIPLIDKHEFRTIFIITRRAGKKDTITTALFRGDALAIQCSDAEKGEGINVIGNDSEYVRDLRLHPHYTQGINPQTKQPQTYVRYYIFFDRLGMNFHDEGVDVYDKEAAKAESNPATPST